MSSLDILTNWICGSHPEYHIAYIIISYGLSSARFAPDLSQLVGIHTQSTKQKGVYPPSSSTNSIKMSVSENKDHLNKTSRKISDMFFESLLGRSRVPIQRQNDMLRLFRCSDKSFE